MKHKYTEEQAKEMLLKSERSGKPYNTLMKKSGWKFKELKALYDRICDERALKRGDT